MPINVYTGLMGSGKSYEVVATPIVEAVGKHGRDVRAYLSGLQPDKIRAFCAEKYNKPLDQIGHVYSLTEADINSPNFYPVEGGDPADSIVKPGEVVIIDEARRFYAADKKPPESHSIFFREHRHIVHPETKIACDIILITQDITDLHRTIRSVIEMTFRTKKLKSLGLTKSYCLQLYEGDKVRKSSLIDTFTPKRYDKRIFALYSSYQGGVGKEAQVDSRQNILANPRFWIITALVIGSLVGCIGYLWAFFHPEPVAKKENKPSQTSQMVAGTSTVASQAVAPAVAVPRPVYRLVGVYTASGQQYALVQTADGLQRYITVSADSTIDGVRSSVVVDGHNVAIFSGIGVPVDQQKGGMFK